MGWREKGAPEFYRNHPVRDHRAGSYWWGKKRCKGGRRREPSLYRELHNVGDPFYAPRANRSSRLKKWFCWDWEPTKMQWRSWKHYRSTQYKVVRME